MEYQVETFGDTSGFRVIDGKELELTNGGRTTVTGSITGSGNSNGEWSVTGVFEVSTSKG
jgi:hypothetical protein